VAAYLVGSRGTLKHAAFLGPMVTVTHTVSVFELRLATLFPYRLLLLLLAFSLGLAAC
jgi:nickel/cobalt transporter (NicO) family protein